jgi:hypothetical protein
MFFVQPGADQIMTKPIRITDLAEPILTQAARDLLEAVSEDMVVLDPDGIMQAASAQSGLSDFGDLEFVERLRVICDAYRADRDLTTMGRLTASTVLIRNAVQRLRHEALWSAHPEIADTAIHHPVIIAGLPRTGTTHLVNLISTDQRLRSLQYWESLEPFPAAGEPVSGDASDPRLQRCADEFAFRDQIMPYFKNMHEMLPRHIHEEAELQMLDFSGQFVETMGILPDWLTYYLAHDQTPHYAYMKRVLQALQWQRGPDRWIMKSPQHIEQLRPLQSTFPDATFVITHRDPVAIMASFCTMIVYSARLGRAPVKVSKITGYWVDRIERMLNSCMEHAGCLPTKNSIHVRFEDFMANDMATIETIYGIAGLPLTADIRAAMAGYIDSNPRGKHGQVVYDLEGDFGLDQEELYKRFAPYMDHFEVTRELD